MPETDSSTLTKVSLREVVEESYRALRSVGYSWGQAQSAGRVAGMAQVLFGSGVQAVITDSKRPFAAKRLPVASVENSHGEIDARKTSFVTHGPMALAMALSGSSTQVHIKRSRASREIAAALWDIEDVPANQYFWGVTGDDPSGYSVRSGSLYRHGSPEKPGRLSWSITSSNFSGGDLILSSEQRKTALETALRSGVEVNGKTWAALKKISWKFLVPE